MRGHAVTRGPILPPPPPIFPPNLHRSRKRTKKRRGGASDLFFFFFSLFFVSRSESVFPLFPCFNFEISVTNVRIPLISRYHEIEGKSIFLMEKLGMETFATKRSKKLFFDPFSAWKRRRRIRERRIN